MSKIFVIEAEERAEKGKSAAKNLRKEQKVPAVVYGAGIEPINISIDFKSITKDIARSFQNSNLSNRGCW